MANRYTLPAKARKTSIESKGTRVDARFAQSAVSEPKDREN